MFSLQGCVGDTARDMDFAEGFLRVLRALLLLGTMAQHINFEARPCRTQTLKCSFVVRFASKTKPTPIALPGSEEVADAVTVEVRAEINSKQAPMLHAY